MPGCWLRQVCVTWMRSERLENTSEVEVGMERGEEGEEGEGPGTVTSGGRMQVNVCRVCTRISMEPSLFYYPHTHPTPLILTHTLSAY